MAKNKRRKRRSSSGPSGGGTPKVRVKVAFADTDLDDATRLVKPAILYADSVTLFSPIASMINELAGLAQLSNPSDQMAVMLQLIQAVPSLGQGAGISPDALQPVLDFLSLDPKLVRALGRATGNSSELDRLFAELDQISDAWGGFGAAIEEGRDKVGGRELFAAVESGVVSVAELTPSTGGTQELADAIAAATGSSTSGALDDVMNGFLAQTLEALSDGKSFPLLDEQTTGLVRALEREAQATPADANLQRGSEITTAVAFMGFLPHFHKMPIDEILDLRSELRAPLVRFRSAVARIAKTFTSRSIDPEFRADAESAWRTDVEPALLEIRETLAEHGLLQEAASIALGDPARLAKEAGAVFAASMAGIVDLSGLVLAAATAGVPVADTAGRAILARERGRRDADKSSFFFLHKVDEASRDAR